MKRTIGAIGFIAAAALVGYFGVAFYEHPPVSSQDFAAWVQAFGSIGAILGAVWVSYDQHDKQRARDEEAATTEIQNILYGLHDEIALNLKEFQENLGAKIKASQRGTPFELTFPVAERPFSIFDGCRGSIGKIRNHGQRSKIILTYGLAHGFIQTFHMNNMLIERRNRAIYIHSQAPNAANHASVVATTNALTGYGDSLRDGWARLEAAAEDMLAALPKPSLEKI